MMKIEIIFAYAFIMVCFLCKSNIVFAQKTVSNDFNVDTIKQQINDFGLEPSTSNPKKYRSTFKSTILRSHTPCDSFLVLYKKDIRKKDTLSFVIDTIAFCKGVEEALQKLKESNVLRLKWAVNSFDVRDCKRYPYEQRNIEIICTGANSTPNILESNKGYNAIMNRAIKSKIGRRKFKKLQKVADGFFGSKDIFNEAFYDNFKKYVTFNETFMGNLSVKLKKNYKIFPRYLNKIKVVDRKHEIVFKFSDLYYGVSLPLDKKEEKKKTKVFRFDISQFDHPKFCKVESGVKNYLVWVDLVEFIEKWSD